MINAAGYDIARFPVEPIDLMSRVIHMNNRPGSAWLTSSGHLPRDSVFVKTGLRSGRTEFLLDESQITAIISDDVERHDVNKTVTQQSYRTIGDTTTSVRTYRIVGVHSNSQHEYISINEHTLRTMDQRSASDFVLRSIDKQGSYIHREFDRLMFLAWTQVQLNFSSGQPQETRTAAADGVLEYEIQTDLSGERTKETADAFFSELQRIQDDLIDHGDGATNVDNYSFSLPRSTLSFLNLREESKMRYDNPRDPMTFNTYNSNAYDTMGLFAYSFDPYTLGEFTDTVSGDGVYGYLHKRGVVGAVIDDYSKPATMFGGTATEGSEFEAALVASLDAAERERDTRANTLLVMKEASQGFFPSNKYTPAQMFHIMIYPLRETQLYRMAAIVDHYSTPVRLQGSQMARLKFRNAKLPGRPASTPIPSVLGTNVKAPVSSYKKARKRSNLSDNLQRIEEELEKNKNNNYGAKPSTGSLDFQKDLQSINEALQEGYETKLNTVTEATMKPENIRSAAKALSASKRSVNKTSSNEYNGTPFEGD